jgi:soluble lytic murein transglycosylase-like protein
VKPYEGLINQIADQEGVPREVAQAYADTENERRDPNDKQDAGRWGGGSFGLFMMTPRTAASLGYQGEPDGLLDPVTNVRLGLRYLRQMFDQVSGGDWSRAAAAYNAGPDMSPWPAAHVDRFLRLLAVWQARYHVPVPAPSPPDFQAAPVMPAGIGALLMLALLGWFLPQLLGKGGR